MNRLSQRIVDIWLSAKALPDPLPQLDFDDARTMYVVPKRYGADRLAVRQALQAHGIEMTRVVSLPVDGKQEKRFDKTLGDLFLADAKVHLIPVSVFWGRRPLKEDSVWRVMFSDNWVVPGFIRRFVTIATQGRRVECFFSPGLSLVEFKELAAPGDDLTRKLKRLLRMHFRRQREAVVGPDLSHRRTLQFQVLTSPSVMEAMAKEPGRAEKKANKYLNEIASDYSYAVLRLFDYFLNWLWRKLYRGVDVKGMKAVHKLATDHELIYVPCHRSHIDYLLLSYVIHHQGLMPPHIAAGINLNMPVIGPILRRGGAFFIRRQFRDNQLYRAVLESYLATMCQKGFPIEYFIEGGRSRTGRLLQPKAGMLVMTLNSIRQENQRPLAFVPVYIGYEKILESHSYINEMYGKTKNKESVTGLLAARHHLKEQFGAVHVSFAEPILEREIWQHTGHDGTRQPPADTEAFHSGVTWLSQAIMTHINRHAVITPANLVATILLGTPKHALLESQLAEYMQAFVQLSRLPRLEAIDVSGLEDLDQAIVEVEQLKLFERNAHALGDVLLLDKRGAISATYLRNNTLHCFIMAGVIASALLTSHRVGGRRLRGLCQQLYPYLKNELFLPWEDAEIPDVVSCTLGYLLELGLITRRENVYFVPDSHSRSHHLLSIVAGTSKGSLERYYMTLQLITSHDQGHYTAETLEADCVLMAQRLSLLYTFHAPDFFDKSLFRTFIQGVTVNGFLAADEDGRLSFDTRLIDAEKRFIYVLSPEVRLGILQITRH